MTTTKPTIQTVIMGAVAMMMIGAIFHELGLTPIPKQIPTPPRDNLRQYFAIKHALEHGVPRSIIRSICKHIQPENRIRLIKQVEARL